MHAKTKVPRRPLQDAVAASVRAVEAFKGDKRSSEYRSLRKAVAAAGEALEAYDAALAAADPVAAADDPPVEDPPPLVVEPPLIVTGNQEEAQEGTSNNDNGIVANADEAGYSTDPSQLLSLLDVGVDNTQKLLLSHKNPDGSFSPNDTLPPNTETYVNTGLFLRYRADKDTGKLGATADSIDHCLFLMLDDIGTKSKVPPLEPTWKIETSPGNFQWGYLYQRNSRPTKAEQAAAVKAIGLAGFSDPGASGPVRWCRLPGSRHKKKQFTARLHELHPTRRFTLPDILDALGVIVSAASTVTTAGAEVLAFPTTDAIADWLRSSGRVRKETPDRIDIICPMAEHDEGSVSSTAYFPPSAANAGRGGFNCQHGTCAEKAAEAGCDDGWTVDDLATKAIDDLIAAGARGGPLVKLLARLSPMACGGPRKLVAKHLTVSVAALDKEVAKAGGQWAQAMVPFQQAAQQQAAAAAAAANPTEGWFDQSLAFEPLTAPEDGALLLTDVVKTIRRFVFCTEHVAVAEAAWAMLTWMQDDLDLLPRMGGMAPAMRCGKSINLDVLTLLCFNPVYATSCSPSVLFRIVQDKRPTLLLDEVDTWLSVKGANEELRGVINAGHKRTGRVLRVNPDTLEPEAFPCFAPAALAGIGRLPATINDRAIPCLLKRKLPGEQADRLLRKEVAGFKPLRARIHRWVTDNREAVRDAIQSGKCLPDLDNDRASEGWEPLLAVAKVVGGDWFKRMMTAAKALENDASNGDFGDDLLLADIREILKANAKPKFKRIVNNEPTDWPGNGHVVNEQWIPAITLHAVLVESQEGDWRDLTTRAMSDKLASFGIKAEPQRLDGDGRKQTRCYPLGDMEDAIKRYLKPDTPEWAQ